MMKFLTWVLCSLCHLFQDSFFRFVFDKDRNFLVLRILVEVQAMEIINSYSSRRVNCVLAPFFCPRVFSLVFLVPYFTTYCNFGPSRHHVTSLTTLRNKTRIGAVLYSIFIEFEEK